MNNSWDTFALFEALLTDFDALLSKTPQRTSETSTELHLATHGFALFHPIEQHESELTEFIIERLDGDLSLEALNWYEEGNIAIRTFNCLALGALFGKLVAGEINNVGFLLGDAHLPGFDSLNNEAICAKYNAGTSKIE